MADLDRATLRLRIRRLEVSERDERLARIAVAQAERAERIERARVARGKMVLVGRNGRLFLRNDTNRVLEQHCGLRPIGERELAGWSQVLQERNDRLARMGIRNCFLIAPNPHAVYSEDLPEEFQTPATRPVEQLLAHLPADLRASVVYPLEAIRSRRHEGHLYPFTDTHWSERGALAAYDEALPFLSDDATDHARLSFIAEDLLGDLGWRVHPPRSSPVERVRIDGPTARCVGDNEVRGAGSVLSFERPGAGNRRLMIFGDSYVWQLLPLACESFDRVQWVHSGAFSYEMIEQERPDAVLGELVERYLVNYPVGTGGGLAERAATKLAAGNVRPRRLHGLAVGDLLADDMFGRRRTARND
jgi:hypothetical protein